MVHFSSIMAINFWQQTLLIFNLCTALATAQDTSLALLPLLTHSDVEKATRIRCNMTSSQRTKTEQNMIDQVFRHLAVRINNFAEPVIM